MKRLFTTALPILLLCTPSGAQTIYPKRTTIYEPGTYDGYTLFAGPEGIVYLIDMDGWIVHTWHSPIPGESLSAVEALPNGNILANSYPTGTNPQRSQTVLELNYGGSAVWSYSLPPSFPAGSTFHHDTERLPNGNTLILGFQPITVPQISPIELVDDFILEVDPGGNVVWSWATWEHFDEFEFSAQAKELIWAKGSDWAHANSISEIPPNSHTLPALAQGNIIVSQRLTNTIFIIDKQTGDVAWHLGPENHLTFGQHAPYMIPQGLTGAGNILVFDNGSGTGYPLRQTAPGVSRVHEIDPVTQTIVWTYDATSSGFAQYSFFSNIVSNAERLPNGNTLICSGTSGRLFEVAPSGDLIWEYMSPFKTTTGTGVERLVVFRAYRLPYSWVPLRRKTLLDLFGTSPRGIHK